MYLKPKVKAPSLELIEKTSAILRQNGTNTICMESGCPNVSECFLRGTATFLILGSICTRNCRFCAVTHSKPGEVDLNEPKRIAKAVNELGLNYVVITSVDRDDLKDLGSRQFVKCVEELRGIKVEVLTPDFQAKEEILDFVAGSAPYKLAHNIETVERLFKKIMPGCSYKKSLKVLSRYAKSNILTKSSIMVGLGEREEELLRTFRHLIEAGVSQLTIGQYLQPSPSHAPVEKYYTQSEFEKLKEAAMGFGFKSVVSGPLVRSSYYADIL